MMQKLEEISFEVLRCKKLNLSLINKICINKRFYENFNIKTREMYKDDLIKLNIFASFLNQKYLNIFWNRNHQNLLHHLGFLLLNKISSEEILPFTSTIKQILYVFVILSILSIIIDQNQWDK